MRSIAGAASTALASGNVALVQLVHLAFAAPIVLNTSTWDLLYSAVTYKGAYGLGSVSAITDKPGEVQGITLELNGGDAARISLALDASDVVQGTVCTIRSAIIETTTYTVVDAPVEWLGYLDTMGISEDGARATVSVTAECKAVDLLRGNLASYSDADQRALYPADISFKYVADQADRPIVWPAREYFFR